MTPLLKPLGVANATRSSAIVRLAIDDTLDEVSDVRFDVITLSGGAGTLVGASLAPDRVVADVFEREVLLDPSSSTRVDARVTLRSGAVVTAQSITIAPRPPDAALANALGGLIVTGEYWQLHVSIVPGSAVTWRCWARRGAWPTLDGSASAAMDERYLRFDGRREETAFSMTLSEFPSDAWHVIAVGVNANGVEGPRLSEVTTFARERGDVPLMLAQARQTTLVQQRATEVLETLEQFTSWLARYQQVGFVGEVGWSFAEPEWNDIARAWFARANAAGLWVAYWAVGEGWFDGYPLEAYVKEGGAWTPRLQAAVLEENLGTPQYLRGLNFSGPDFDAPGPLDQTHSFSNVNRFTTGGMYGWNTADIYTAMAARGFTLARLPFRWERIQPTLYGALDAGELGRMQQSVTAAIASGLQVILDVHNYGAYWLHENGIGVRRTIGTSQVPTGAFADLWSRLATAFNGVAGVIGYGLMNEPVAMTPAPALTPALTWAAAAQAAITAIRNAALPSGAQPKLVLVPGYNWGGVWSFEAEHRDGPFVSDPANLVRYEGHQYFDADHSGTYSQLEFAGASDQRWLRWFPNAVMWDAHKTAEVSENPYRIEVYRAGSPARLSIVDMWMKGYSDAALPATQPAEYRLVAINTIDDSIAEYAVSVTGAVV